MKQVRFCEFTGDDAHEWDESGYKQLCPYAGFTHCTLYHMPLFLHEGWRACYEECRTPIQIKTIHQKAAP